MPTIKKFTGLNNVSPPRDARPGDLQTASNVLITDGGSIKRRSGKVEISNDPTHSLFAVDDVLYYVQDGALTMNDLGPVALVDPLADAASWMYYALLNNQVYFSNGVDSGIISNGTALSWGVAAPEQPLLASTTGSGDPGTYLISLTYLLSDGQESAASQTVAVNTTGGGITITNISASSDTRVTHVCVYVSGPDGEAGPKGSGLFRALTLANGTTSATVTNLPSTGPECYTLNLSPMPAGKFIGFYRGRMYVAVGQFLLYSEPWAYALTALDHNFLPFETDIIAVIYLENGIWVGTTKGCMFLAGTDPEAEGGFNIKSRLAGACLTGGITVDHSLVPSRVLPPAGLVGLFVTTDGVCAVDGSGLVDNLTGKHWVPATTTGGPIGAVNRGDDETLYIFNDGDDAKALNLSTRAVTNFIDDCTSFAYANDTLYAAGATGLWSLDGDDDDGTAIAASFGKEGMDFGSNRIKSIPSLVMHAKVGGALAVTVAGRPNDGTVTLTDAIMDMHGSWVRLPRGVSGRNLALTVANVDGAYFEVAEMDIEVAEADYRRERQVS